MVNENAISTRCKLIVFFVTILILIETLVVKQWEDSINTKVISSLSGFQAKSPGWLEINITEKLQVPARSVFSLLHDKTNIQKELEQRLQNATGEKIILVWVPGFGVRFPDRKVNLSNCGNCLITYDRGKIDGPNVGAVVFHFDALKSNDMPPNRNSDHLYIYWTMESTASLRVVRGISLLFENSLKFNATMTYRRDSDFFASYQTDLTIISRQVSSKNLTLDGLLKMKTKSAIAIVSNCVFTPGARTRMKMLNELLKLDINLEAYGGCFPGHSFARGGEFHKNVQKYKFYFSFENSHHCKDYITEKLFSNALLSLAVPVVWGSKKEDYEAIAPPGSFIFAEDFDSMNDLAEYLKYLMGNDAAYMKYFRWISMKPSEIIPNYERKSNWCQICRALHGINIDDIYNPKYDASNPERPFFFDGISKRTMPNLKDWFYGEENPECFHV